VVLLPMNHPVCPPAGAESVYPVCLLYADDAAREREVACYVRSAVQAGAGVVYVTSGDAAATRLRLRTCGVPVAEAERHGRLVFASSVAAGYAAVSDGVAATAGANPGPAVHLAGEAGSVFSEVWESGERWRPDADVSGARLIVLNQYDMRCHAADELLEVLARHPGILLSGACQQNPYYEAGATAAARLARRLSFLGHYGAAPVEAECVVTAGPGDADHADSGAAHELDLLRTLVEATPDLVGIRDLAGRLLYRNRAGREFFGVGVDGEGGRSELHEVHPAWAIETIVAEAIPSAVRDGSWIGDSAIVDGNGREVPVSQLLVAHADGAGGVAYLSSIMRDVSGLRAQEAARHDTEQRFRTFFEQLPLAVFVYDAAGVLTATNPAVQRLWRAELSDAPANYCIWTDPQLDAAGVLPCFRRAYAGEAVRVPPSQYDINLTTGRSDGATLWVEAHLFPIRNSEGAIHQVVAVQEDVTERVNAEHERERLVLELQAERDKWRQVFDVAPAFMAVLRGEDHVFELANPAFLDFIGHREMVGRSLLDALPELESQGTKGRLDHVLQSGAAFCAKEFAVRLAHRAGEPLEERYATLVYLPITEADGSRSGVLCHGVDVTEQVRARQRVEEAAAEAELNTSRLNAVLEALPVGICVLDTDGRVDLANAAAMEPLVGLLEASGLSGEGACSARRTRSGEPLSPEDWPVARALSTGEDAADEEIEIDAPDGTRRTVVASGRLFRDAAGEILGAIGVTVDVTTRKQGEDALRESEERFRTLVSSTKDVVFTLDTELRHTSMYGGLEMAQEARDFFYGKRAREVLGEEKAAVHEAAAARALAGEHVVYEWEGRIRGERRFNQTSLSPLRNASGQITGVIGAGRDVTDLKRIREARRESDARFRLLIEGIEGVVFYVQDRDGVLEYVSPSVEKAIGYSPDELVGGSLADFCADDASRETLRKRTRALLEDRATGELSEVLLRTRTGTVAVIEIFDSVLARDGVVIGMQGVARDITRQRAAESAATQLGRIMETSVSEIYLIDRATGRYLQASHGALENLGYTAEELCDLRPADLLDSASLQCLERETEPLLDGRLAVLRVEGEQRRKDGSWYPVEARIQLARTADREVIVATASDVSERRRAEKQLRLLERAVEQSPATIVVTDPSGTIVYVNRKFTESSGYPVEEALGANPRLVKSGAHDQAFYEDLWATLLSQREWTGDMQNRRKDGSLYWEHASISAVVDATGQTTHYLGIKEDVTARRRLEEQLRQSQKMEAVGQLAGGIAHDFNNMLTAIQGFSGLLESEVPPDSAGAVYLAEVQKAAERSAALTRQLLAYSRKQILQPRIMDMNETITGLESMLQRLIGEDVQLRTKLEPGLPPIFADPRQMEQVLMNMAVNARDAMPGGGCLEIATQRVDLPVAAADPRTRGRSWIATTIADTGHGMDAETAARIFEPFFTTKPVGEGTGLGMPMAHGIVTQSGGYIEVESTPGAGSSFRILLPAATGGNSDGRPVAEPDHSKTGTETIIVVEDEDAVRALSVAVLSRAGYRVLAAHTGEAAIALAEETDTPVHLLLTDVVMPGINGRELASVLQESRPELKVLFMSGYTDDAVLRAGVIADDCHFLQKPFQPQALLMLVREILGEASPQGRVRLAARGRPCADGVAGPHCRIGLHPGRNEESIKERRRRHSA
jgi:two-component system, cell cycle sensor histidine kinase and response regulator CckA